MEQNHIIKSPKKNLTYYNYCQKNIFDEDFLSEKDKALSPIELSDVVPGETTIKSLKDKAEEEKYLKLNEEKDIKYGSNIIYIESKINDNDEEFRSIMNEQIWKIVILQRFCKKSHQRRRMRNVI